MRKEIQLELACFAFGAAIAGIWLIASRSLGLGGTGIWGMILATLAGAAVARIFVGPAPGQWDSSTSREAAAQQATGGENETIGSKERPDV